MGLVCRALGDWQTDRSSAIDYGLPRRAYFCWVFFCLCVFFVFLFAFPWFFLGKQQFPYVLDGFGVIFLGFPTKKHVFCFSLVFPRENSSFLMFWTDLA